MEYYANFQLWYKLRGIEFLLTHLVLIKKTIFSLLVKQAIFHGHDF